MTTTARVPTDPDGVRVVGGSAPSGGPGTPRRTRRGLRWFGRHRVIAALAVIALVLSPWEASFASAMTGAGAASLSARAAEWARDHGGASAVSWIENLWYSHHPPPKGGRPP